MAGTSDLEWRMLADVADLEAHRTALTGHCYRMLGSPFDAEDANEELRSRGKPTHSTLTTKLVGSAVAVAGFDAWEMPA